MTTLLESQSIDIPKNDIKITYDIPNRCPMCGTAFADSPLSLLHHFQRSDLEIRTASVFFCPVCNDFFFEKGVSMGITTLANINPFNLNRHFTLPVKKQETLFPEKIGTISPDFVSIYHQTEAAEENGYIDIVGMGYRKALEFLVKDYLIKTKPELKGNIESARLGACIDNYIDNEKIKTLAKGSAWLGNDETHYCKKHPDKTIEDMKSFIHGVVYYIEYEYTLAEATKMIEGN